MIKYTDCGRLYSHNPHLYEDDQNQMQSCDGTAKKKEA